MIGLSLNERRGRRSHKELSEKYLIYAPTRMTWYGAFSDTDSIRYEYKAWALRDVRLSENAEVCSPTYWN